jgi:hypothetical protein
MTTIVGLSADFVSARIEVGLGERGPKLWRTILVDGQTGLPIYEIFAAAGELDSPIWKTQYTYPATLRLNLLCNSSAPPTLLLVWGGDLEWPAGQNDFAAQRLRQLSRAQETRPAGPHHART